MHLVKKPWGTEAGAPHELLETLLDPVEEFFNVGRTDRADIDPLQRAAGLVQVLEKVGVFLEVPQLCDLECQAVGEDRVSRNPKAAAPYQPVETLQENSLLPGLSPEDQVDHLPVGEFDGPIYISYHAG